MNLLLFCWLILIGSTITQASAGSSLNWLAVFHQNPNRPVLRFKIGAGLSDLYRPMQHDVIGAKRLCCHSEVGRPLAGEGRRCERTGSGAKMAHAAFVAQQHGARNEPAALPDTLNPKRAARSNMQKVNCG